ncbi:hypothetical protein OC842_005527 [Tilletia horrida]|uniref:Zn(2)-C6 fungal-type domain-containing protein n=1 Tax=Tilletia horrida TaxID=155126 RepID=A0AAN6G906_9BASI|nr:hypothetical protein OC842_005527 [Tilletia horrida]
MPASKNPAAGAAGAAASRSNAAGAGAKGSNSSNNNNISANNKNGTSTPATAGSGKRKADKSKTTAAPAPAPMPAQAPPAAPAPAPAPDPTAAEQGDNSAEGNSKKRRIWAACENCRIRKSKCDGKQPCSICLHRARNMLLQHASHALRTQQQQNPHKFASDPAALTPPEPSEFAVLEKAQSMCVIDWNRKPRGPKSKANKAAADAQTQSIEGAAAAAAAAAAAFNEGMPPPPPMSGFEYGPGMPAETANAQSSSSTSASGSVAPYKKTVRSSTRIPGETAYQRQQQEIKQAQRERERHFQLHQQELIHQQHQQQQQQQHPHQHQYAHPHQMPMQPPPPPGAPGMYPPNPYTQHARASSFGAGGPPGSTHYPPSGLPAGYSDHAPPPPPPPPLSFAYSAHPHPHAHPHSHSHPHPHHHHVPPPAPPLPLPATGPGPGGASAALPPPLPPGFAQTGLGPAGSFAYAQPGGPAPPPPSSASAPSSSSIPPAPAPAPGRAHSPSALQRVRSSTYASQQHDGVGGAPPPPPGPKSISAGAGVPSSSVRAGWERDPRERERAEWDWEREREREREAREARDREWESQQHRASEWSGGPAGWDAGAAPPPPSSSSSSATAVAQARDRKRSAPGDPIYPGVKRESREWERERAGSSGGAILAGRDWERERERERDRERYSIGSAVSATPGIPGGVPGSMDPPLLTPKLSPRSGSMSSIAGAAAGPTSAPPTSGTNGSSSGGGGRLSLFGSHILTSQPGGGGAGGRPSLTTSSSSPSILASMPGYGPAPFPHVTSEGPVPYMGPAPRAGEAGLETGIASGESRLDSGALLTPTKPANAGTLLVQIRTGSLLTALRDIYSEHDRRYISIAIAHYDVFDNSHKMFPSRILFGERILPGATIASSNPPTGLVTPLSPHTQAPYVAPAHLQVALLSILAHRALLTPDGLSLRDLDPNVVAKAGLPPMTFPAPSARPTGAVAALSSAAAGAAVTASGPLGSGSTPTSISSPSARSSLAGSGSGTSSSSSVGNGAYQSSWLNAHDRKGLLEFARRSLRYAHGVFVSKIERGEVEPSLIITGWLLDMSASEDGVGTTVMANMKATLFGILRKWNLHLMDSDPHDMSVVGPSHSFEEHFQHLDALSAGGVEVSARPLAERARAYDARQLVKCPIERESLRRVVRIICTSYLWTHALDNPPPKFEFDKIQIRQTEYDDYIHQNSAWLKGEHSHSGAMSVKTLQMQHDLWTLYTRLVYMMNTPLVDLLAGVGPEKDLQDAVTSMELTLQDIKRSTPPVRFDEDEQPLRIHLYFDTRMVELLLYRHLFPLYAYTKNAGISFNESYVSASSVFPSSSSPSNYERFMGHQPASYSVENPYVYPSSDGTGSRGGPALSDNSSSEAYGKKVGLRFTRDPQRACFAPLFDIGRFVQAALVRLPRDRTLPSLPGSEAGAVLPTVVRMLRWPRHLRLFAQHAFTLAAEVAVAGMAWDRLTGSGEDDDPGWVSSPSMEGIPRSNSPQLVTSVWNIGCAIVDLMFAMAHAGSKHAGEMADKAEAFKEQRAAIMVGHGWCFRPRRGVAWSSNPSKYKAPPRFEGSADDEYDPDDEEAVLSPGMGKWYEPGM